MPELINVTPQEIGQGALIGEPAATALNAGRLIMTIQSKQSGEHITIRATCKHRNPNGRWERCTFTQASHIFLDVPRPDGGWPDQVASYYTQGARAGQLWTNPDTDPARAWCARRILRIAAGRAEWEDDQARVLQGSRCIYCGRELTDPESILREMGPECAKTCSSSRHQLKGCDFPPAENTSGIPAVYRSTPAHNDPARAGADWTYAENTAGTQPPRDGLFTLHPGGTPADVLAHQAELVEAAQP
jgi:hypothetical protein